jgi:hypothetical protein
MILSEEAFVMLLDEARFRDFTRKEICDTAASTEGIFALSASSRAEVDELVKTATGAGGTHALPPMDYGFMSAGASTTSTGTTGKCSGWIRPSSSGQRKRQQPFSSGWATSAKPAARTVFR